MRAAVTRSPGRITLTVTGEVDLAVADELRKVGTDAIEAGPLEALYIDLSGVSFMDSTGLNALIRIRKASAAPVTLVAPAPQVARLLKLTALDQLFAIEVGQA